MYRRANFPVLEPNVVERARNALDLAELTFAHATSQTDDSFFANSCTYLAQVYNDMALVLKNTHDELASSIRTNSDKINDLTQGSFSNVQWVTSQVRELMDCQNSLITMYFPPEEPAAAPKDDPSHAQAIGKTLRDIRGVPLASSLNSLMLAPATSDMAMTRY